MHKEKYFTHIYKTHYTKLYNYAYTLTKDRQRAEDITQQTFTRFWENIDKYTLEKEEVFLLLFVIAKRIEIDEARKYYVLKRKFEQEQKQNLQETASEDLHVHLVRKEMRIAVNNAVEQLPEQKRKIFILHKEYGYPHKEIAQRLNISIDTVRAHLKQSLVQMRKEMSKKTLLFFL